MAPSAFDDTADENAAYHAGCVADSAHAYTATDDGHKYLSKLHASFSSGALRVFPKTEI